MIVAQVKSIDGNSSFFLPPVEIIWNQLEITISEPSKVNSKYKKVGINEKMKLISLVKSGSSIIHAANTLGINYSTAKSIFQNIKTKSHRKLKRKSYVPEESQKSEATTKKDNDLLTD